MLSVRFGIARDLFDNGAVVAESILTFSLLLMRVTRRKLRNCGLWLPNVDLDLARTCQLEHELEFKCFTNF